MRKILITMMAIAFSLSAYSSGISKLDEYKKSGKALITVWCIGETVVVETSKGGLTQFISGTGDGDALTCSQYRRRTR